MIAWRNSSLGAFSSRSFRIAFGNARLPSVERVAYQAARFSFAEGRPPPKRYGEAQTTAHCPQPIMIGLQIVKDHRAPGCFLCEVSEDLVYARTPSGLALCGLGPLMPGYSVAAAGLHIPSAADALQAGHTGYLAFVLEVRDFLTDMFGGYCLLTEHGRVPFCHDRIQLERHCYHAHFLLFPNPPAVDASAVKLLGKTKYYDSLEGALREARRGEYFLLSEAPTSYLIMRTAEMPRQFARTIVAAALGKAELSSWAQHPQHQAAVEIAGRLRTEWRSKYSDA